MRNAPLLVRSVRLGLGLAVLLAVVSPAAARAAIHVVTIAGTVEGFVEPPGFLLDGSPPVNGGESFTLSFHLDDAAPRVSMGPEFALYYPAISNVSFTISGVGSIGADAGFALTAINTSSNHQWSTFVESDALNFAGTPLETLSLSNTSLGEDEDFTLDYINVDLFDLSESVYTETPPELVAPSSSSFPLGFGQVYWLGGSSLASASIELSVDSVSSAPVGAPVPLLAPAPLGLLGLGMTGVASIALRSRWARA